MTITWLLKIGPARNLIYLVGNWRAKNVLARISPLLKESLTIIDIGSGSCNIAELLIKNRKKVTALDIKNLSAVPDLNPVLYRGGKIPFPNLYFDTALLICALHHAKNPEKLLKEAKRVARNIIVLEDIYENMVSQKLTHFFDNLLSLEFFRNPHSNKTDKGWRELFNKLELDLEYSDYYRSLLVFHHALYFLKGKPR